VVADGPADRPCRLCRCARAAASGCRAGHAGRGTGNDRALPRHAEWLHRVHEQGVKVAVASNLAQCYADPLKALLSDLVDIWRFAFNAGAIKPERALHADLTARLGCEASELLMVGDTWRDDIVGAVEAGSRSRWVNRESCAR
jgi:FMN phosphatase YigB (HAD superfamily)